MDTPNDLTARCAAYNEIYGTEYTPEMYDHDRLLGGRVTQFDEGWQCAMKHLSGATEKQYRTLVTGDIINEWDEYLNEYGLWVEFPVYRHGGIHIHRSNKPARRPIKLVPTKQY